MRTFHLYLYGPSRGPIPSSFEETEARLRELPKLYFEADGSFVWTLDEGQQKVYGMVYDAVGQVQYCDLRGDCKLKTWQRLCLAIAGDAADGLELVLLPGGQWQNLQSFEQRWLQD